MTEAKLLVFASEHNVIATHAVDGFVTEFNYVQSYVPLTPLNPKQAAVKPA